MPDVLSLGNGATLPRIAWQSVLEDATLASANPVTSNGALSQCADWTCWTYWKPTGGGPYVITATLNGAQTVNGWAIAGHNAAGLCGMDYWNGSAWVVFAEQIVAGDGRPVYLVDAPVVTTQLRFRFASLTYLAVLWAGVDMELPEGIAPGWSDPVLAMRAKLYPEVSRSGVFLGAAVEMWNAALKLDIKNLDAFWVRDNWYPFLRRCTTQPFLLHWHKDDWPNSAVLCTNANFGGTAFSSQGFVDVSVSFDADAGLDGRLTAP